MMQELMQRLGENSAERLRWLVCRGLGVFPYSELSDESIIKCGLHMLLDRRDGGAEFSKNSAFDEAGYLMAKEAEESGA